VGITVAATAALSGVQAEVFAGTMALPNSATVALSGAALTISQGTIFLPGFWSPVVDTNANLWIPVVDTAPNAWAEIN
jgi:hypothetical protein